MLLLGCSGLVGSWVFADLGDADLCDFQINAVPHCRLPVLRHTGAATATTLPGLIVRKETGCALANGAPISLNQSQLFVELHAASSFLFFQPSI